MNTKKTNHHIKPPAHVLGWTLLFSCAIALNAMAAVTLDVRNYGAKADGTTLDSPAIQRAIDEASALGEPARIHIGPGTYLIGTIELRSNIELHLDKRATLIISTNREHYRADAVIYASNAANVKITGHGRILGCGLEFMTRYDSEGEWWIFGEWRPKMFILTGCTNLVIRDITYGEAPFWGLHMLGCHHVLVERLKVRNYLDIPNCDGVVADHCTDVVIRHCDIRCGDDAIVIKTTRQPVRFGPSANIHVHDCVLETQDSGLKIGTESTEDIHDILFERCTIKRCCRGLTIQLRDEGSVYNVTFRDITFQSQYHADPWWGRGESISFTAIPRTPETRLGCISNVFVLNVTGRAENSARICGMPGNPIRHVVFKNVSLTVGRWTKYRGGVFDNRPTTVIRDIEPHDTAGIFIRHAEDVSLEGCRVRWLARPPAYFGPVLWVTNATGVKLRNFRGSSANPNLYSDVLFQ